MKKLLAITAALGVLATSVPASAAPWENINARQARLEHRINAGVRDGSLTRREAYNLRGRFNNIARREARYRRDGLSAWERRDLNRRFDNLSASIEAQRNDSQNHGYRG